MRPLVLLPLVDPAVAIRVFLGADHCVLLVIFDAVDTAVKTLTGEPVAKNVLADIITFEEKDVDKYYRPDLNDQYWAINKLPENLIAPTYKKK